MGEIATLLKDGLIEDGKEDAYQYMADVVELSDIEAEYLGLDVKRYKDASDEAARYTVPSSTGGDYSPTDPWNAPGMSASDVPVGYTQMAL